MWTARVGALALALAFALSLLAAQSALGAQPRPHTPGVGDSRPRIGLALSGGGARGFAHVGVLRALEALRVPIDCIAGTSAGSAVGAAYALGMSPDEIEAALRSADWDEDMFKDQPARPDLPFRAKERVGGAPIGVTLGIGPEGLKGSAGIFAGQKIELFLHRMFGLHRELESFDGLPIPFRAITTDLATGAMVVQDRGSLVHAVRASMAVPGAFAPVRIGSRVLVDGGLTQNLPVQAVREACAERVIAINIGSPLLGPEELGSVFSVALQMVGILMERNVAESVAQLGPKDVLVVPELAQISPVDFGRGTDGIPAGEAATLRAHERLSQFSLSEPAYREWQRLRAARRLRQADVNRVRVAPTRFVAPEYFALAGVDEGRAPGPVHAEALERQILRWSGSGHFTSIEYTVRPERDGYTLWLDPKEKPWGPDYLQIGFAGSADSHSYADFSVKAVLRKTWQNRSGGEWLTLASFGRTREFETRWFQPIGVGSAWYVEPRLSLVSQPWRVFVGNRLLGEFRIDRDELELGAGVQGPAGEAHVGIVAARIDTAPSVGFTGVAPFRTNVSGLRARATLDSLDDLDFPRRGRAVRAEAFLSTRGLGASSRYRRVGLDWIEVASWGRHTLRARARLERIIASDRDTLDVVATGGFLNLSGFQSGQFLGRGLAFGSLSYYQRLRGLPQPFGSGVFAGASLELGRVTEPLGLDQRGLTRASVALFAGASTALGPAYLGLGFGQAGERTLYLFIGRP